MDSAFTPAERRALERTIAQGGSACPRCGTAVERRAVPPPAEVAYVRDRIWVVCGGCGASAVLDRRRVQRSGGTDPDPA